MIQHDPVIDLAVSILFALGIPAIITGFAVAVAQLA